MFSKPQFDSLFNMVLTKVVPHDYEVASYNPMSQVMKGTVTIYVLEYCLALENNVLRYPKQLQDLEVGVRIVEWSN